MACCHLFFGFCVSLIMIAAGTSQNTECSLSNYFRCASLIGSMEDVDTLKNNKTCAVLERATSCVKNLWRKCEYECGFTEYHDKSKNTEYKCAVHRTYYVGPMNKNLKARENPCVLLKTLEDCLPGCVDVTSSTNRRLDEVQLTERETQGLQERRKCPNGVVEKYIKRYESYQPEDLDFAKCTEIKLSNKYFLDDLSMEENTPNCVGSSVQQMVVDAIGFGVDRYIQLCEFVEPEKGTAKCQASLISGSLTAIFAVAIGYMFSH